MFLALVLGIASLLLEGLRDIMASFLKHRFSQVLGLSDLSTASNQPQHDARPRKRSNSAPMASDPGPNNRENSKSPGAQQSSTAATPDGQENRLNQRSKSAQAFHSPEPKRTLQKMASNTFKMLSETLRSKAQYLYTESERAKLASDAEPPVRLGGLRKGSRSRLLDSIKKHRSMGSRKSHREGHKRVGSMGSIAKMDPSSVEESHVEEYNIEAPSPSIDVSIPHSNLIEPGQKYPWMGSRKGREFSTRSHASLIDQNRLWPSPVAIAVRKSSRGATGVATHDNEKITDTSKSHGGVEATNVAKPAADRKASAPAAASEAQTSAPLPQRRLSIFKVFQNSATAIHEARERGRSASNESADKSTEAEPLPSMGSKSDWERARADRQRRYEEIAGGKAPDAAAIANTESEYQEARAESPSQAHNKHTSSNMATNGSVSSGSHYDSDLNTTSSIRRAAESIDRTSGPALERTSVSGESWTTSPETAIESSTDAVVSCVEDVLKTNNDNSDSATCIGGLGLNRNPFEDAVDSSPRSQSTTESCAVTTHDSPCYDSSRIVSDHHRTLSHHGEVAPEALPLPNEDDDGTGQSAYQSVPMSMPGAWHTPEHIEHVDTSSEGTRSSTRSLPRLRRMPATSLFHTTDHPSAPAEYAADSGLEVMLPSYDNVSPSRNAQEATHMAPREGQGAPPGPYEGQEVPPVVENTSAHHRRPNSVQESAFDSVEECGASDSSSSVGSWLRTHPDFEGEPSLNNLSASHSRTLSAELLRYSYIHSCTVARSDHGQGVTLLRSEENVSLSSRPGSTKPSTVATTRHSSAEDSTLLGSDTMDTESTADSSRRHRESLIPVPVNSSRLNLVRESPEAPKAPRISPPSAARFLARKDADTDVSAARTPEEPAKRHVPGTRIPSYSPRAPASDPATRQVRFPDDTPEMLASRAERSSEDHSKCGESSSVASSSLTNSPSLRKRRSMPRIPVPKTHQKWSPVRSRRW